EDVIFTFERITDPDDPKTAAANFTMLDKVVATGERTVEFRLTEPNGLFNDAVAEYTAAIVPVGYDPENPVCSVPFELKSFTPAPTVVPTAEFRLTEPKGLFNAAVAEDTAAMVPVGYDPESPVCSGPFKLKSFTPAQSTVLVPNEHYFDNDKMYLDEVEVLNFNDDDALINALLSTQVDAIAGIPLSLVEVIDADERMSILNSETGMWLPFTMRVDKKPFDDVKVRQAFRLVVDREQMIEQVLSGFGTIG